MFRNEWLRMGSSAARAALLSMMKTRMRLVKMWWLMSLWQPTRILLRKALCGHQGPRACWGLQGVGPLGGETRRRLAQGQVALVVHLGRAVGAHDLLHKSYSQLVAVERRVPGFHRDHLAQS